MRPLKVDTAIMCEFIAESTGNKHTLVNVISGDLVVSQFPAQLPVAFYFEITPSVTESADFVIEISFGKRKAAGAKAHVEFEAGKRGVIALPIGLLGTDKPGEIRVTFARDGERPITLLKKKVLAGPPPTLPNVSQQLSEQSQPDAPDSSSQPEPSPPISPKKRRRS